MSYKSLASKGLHYFRIGLAGLAMFQFTICAPFANAADQPQSATASPITHVIVIIGENRSFDHVFATYQPKHGETVTTCFPKVSLSWIPTRMQSPVPTSTKRNNFLL